MVEHEVTGWMDRVSIAISRVSMFLVAVIVAIIFFEVVMRYLFEQPTLWVNEMSLWLAGMIYLLAGLTSCNSAATSESLSSTTWCRACTARVRPDLNAAYLSVCGRGGLGRLQRGLGKIDAVGNVRHSVGPADPGDDEAIDVGHLGADRHSVRDKSDCRLGPRGEEDPRDRRGYS